MRNFTEVGPDFGTRGMARTQPARACRRRAAYVLCQKLIRPKICRCLLRITVP
jgi:hypothetical protein